MRVKVIHKNGGVISTATPTGPEIGVCRVGQRETDESDTFEGTASSGQKDPGFAASLNPGIVSCQTPSRPAGPYVYFPPHPSLEAKKSNPNPISHRPLAVPHIDILR